MLHLLNVEHNIPLFSDYTLYNGFMDKGKIFALLKKYDTPTICNAIEIIKGKRQGSGFTRGQVFSTAPDLPPMVGYAKTATISGAEPSQQTPQEILALRLAYHSYMAEEPRPAIAVVEDLDYPNPIACFFGEINMVVHRGLGLDGVLTSGLVRDLDALYPKKKSKNEIAIIASAVGVSHAHVTVKGFNQEVDIMGIKVKPGQIIHADKHGAVVIENEEMLRVLPAAIAKLIDREHIVIDAAKEKGFNGEKLNQAWLRFVNSKN